MTLEETGRLAGLGTRQAARAHRNGLRGRVGRHDEAAAISDSRERERAAGDDPDPGEVRAVSRELARLTLLAVPDLEDAARSVQDDLARWRDGPPSVELVDDIRSLLYDLRDRQVDGQFGEFVTRGAALLLPGD